MNRRVASLSAAALPAVAVAALLLSLVFSTNAQAPQSRSVLPLSPLSGGLLMAQAIHSGAVRPSGFSTAFFNPNLLTCSPRPCVLPNVQASEGGQPVNETPIAANPLKTTQLLTGGNDYNCSTSLQGFFASGDGGSTWNHTCLGTLSGKVGFGDPGVGYDTANNAYIIGIDGNSSFTGFSVVFEKSTDNGTTWTSPVTAVSPTQSRGLTDKPWLQVDTQPLSPHVNSLYISVTQFDSTFFNTEMSVSHSNDGGTTWATVVVDTLQVFPNIDQFSDLAIGSDGTVYLSWMRCKANGPAGDCGGTNASMMFSKSTDGGTTWSSPVLMATVGLVKDGCFCAFYGSLPNTSERVSDIPALDIDNSTGTNAGHLYAAMYNWTGTQMQVVVVTSTDGGATWGAPVRVASASNDEFFPWLTVARNGHVGVTWLDRRNDPANTNYEAFGAISANGGASFGANADLSSTPSDPFNDGFGGSFMGDYTGNIWSGRALFASWTDTRSLTTGQDEIGGIVPH